MIGAHQPGDATGASPHRDHFEPSGPVKRWIVVAVIAILAVGGFFVLRGRHAKPSVDTPAKASGTMTLGQKDAPITVVEYSDFQCPYCRIFARDIQPKLIEEYVDTGLVRFEWRNFPIFGRFSSEAALGAFCADDQQAFWPYHDALFEVVGELSARERNLDTLLAIADDIGLDVKTFRTCLETGRHADRVRQNYEEGRALNIIGTPSFTVNGMLLVGAQPLETWHRVFDSLLD